MSRIAEKKPQVVVPPSFFPEVAATELAPHFEVLSPRTARARRAALRGAEGLITLFSDPVDAKLLKAAPRLRAVGNFAVGLNNIDLAACHARGVRVCNTPDVLTRACAEFTLALLLATARRIPEGERLCRSGRFRGWAPDLLLGVELRGRRAVIVGAGRIGSETAALFRAVGLQVETIARTDRAASVDAKLRRAQVLSLHFPLTPATHHWLDERKLALLPRDCIVLNTTRGPTVDETALIRALRERRILAAGLDVFEFEPRIPVALRRLPNVTLLPHVASATREARIAMAQLAARGVAGILRGKRPANEVKPS